MLLGKSGLSPPKHEPGADTLVVRHETALLQLLDINLEVTVGLIKDVTKEITWPKVRVSYCGPIRSEYSSGRDAPSPLLSPWPHDINSVPAGSVFLCRSLVEVRSC